MKNSPNIIKYIATYKDKLNIKTIETDSDEENTKLKNKYYLGMSSLKNGEIP